MITKHTPGPWTANFEHHARENDAQFMVCEGGDIPIAVLSADGFIGIGERKANTRLIAAAPELLAALTRLASAAFARDTTMGDQCALFAAQAELRDATKVARAAIAKATGAAT